MSTCRFELGPVDLDAAQRGQLWQEAVRRVAGSREASVRKVRDGALIRLTVDVRPCGSDCQYHRSISAMLANNTMSLRWFAGSHITRRIGEGNGQLARGHACRHSLFLSRQCHCSPTCTCGMAVKACSQAKKSLEA